MAAKKEAIILEPGYAITKDYIMNLRPQDGNTYFLGYINYESP